MTDRVPVPGWIWILRKRPPIREDLPVLHIALGQDDHAAGNHENAFVIIICPDSWSPARHAMNVWIEPLLDASFLNQFRSPRLIRHGCLQARRDVGKLARYLRIVALCAAVRPGYPAIHA